MKLERHLLVALCFAVCATPATAQFPPNYAASMMWPVVANPCPGGKCPAVSNKRSSLPRTTSTTKGPAPTARTGDLTFHPSPALRKQNLARFAAQSGNDPGLTDIAAKADLIFPQMDALFAQNGLKSNNVGDAYAVWWISAYDAVHGNTATRPAAIYNVVRAQAAQAVLATPKFANATDAVKQEMAEALLVQTIAIDVSIEQAKNNPQQLRKIAQAVGQGSRRMGMDLERFELTEQGFKILD